MNTKLSWIAGGLLVLCILVLFAGLRLARYYEALAQIPNSMLLRAELAEADAFSVISTPATDLERIGVRPQLPGLPVPLLAVTDEARTQEWVRGIVFESDAHLSFWRIPDQVDLPVCSCPGEFELLFFADVEVLARFYVVHGRVMRWRDGPWIGDGRLTAEAADRLLQMLKEWGFDARELLDGSAQARSCPEAG